MNKSIRPGSVQFLTWQRCLHALSVLGVLTGLAPSALAYPRMVYEQEPNDSAAQAETVSGELHLIAETGPQDDDYFHWVLDDVAADKRWRLELSADEGVTAEIEFLLPHTVVNETTPSATAAPPAFGVASFGQAGGSVPEADEDALPEATAHDESVFSLQAAAEPALQEGLLVAAGEYLIRISGGERDGKYQLLLREADDPGVAVRPDAEGAFARTVDAGRTWLYQSENRELVLPLPGEDARQQWHLQVAGELGTPLEAWLASDTGERLSSVVAASTLQHVWPMQVFSGPVFLHLRHQQSDAPLGRVSVRLDDAGRLPETAEMQTSEPPQEEAVPPEVSPAVAEVGNYWRAPDQHQPGWEQEPNDQASQATPLILGESIQGYFATPQDIDQFKFSLPGENRLTLTLEPADGQRMTAWIYWHDVQRLQVSVDSAQQFSTWLPPGDYTLELRSSQATTSPYRASVSLMQPWADQNLFLPASEQALAPLLPESGLISPFMGGEPGQGGWIRLPVSDSEREISWQGNVHRNGYAHYTGLNFITAEGEELHSRHFGLSEGSIVIPGQTNVFVDVSFGGDASDVVLQDPAWQAAPALPWSLAISADVKALAAFSAQGQEVALSLELYNAGEESITLPLHQHLSHEGAELIGLPETLTLSPGEHLHQPLQLRLPPQLSDASSLSLFVKAGEPGQSAVLTFPLLADAAPSQPFTVPALDQALLGLTNLTWSALGAGFEGPDSALPLHYPALLDGLANADFGVDVRSALGEALPPIRLAGEGGQVHAIVFNQRSPHVHSRRWRQVEVSLGASADNLEVVMSVELAATAGEQIFMLDKVRDARYVSLRPLSVWGERTSSHGTGVLRVLGEPTGTLANQRHDLLAPALGGHWVYTLPDIPALYGASQFEVNRSVNESNMQRGQDSRGRQVEMVLGFLEQRLAQIDELHWQDAPDWQGQPLEQVELFTSTVSPAGPWASQGQWLLQRDETGRAIRRFEQPVPARYLRLSFTEPTATEGESARWRIPSSLSAFEASSLDSRASILGYWGIETAHGPWENGQGAPQDGEIATVLDVDDSESNADRPYSLDGKVSARLESPGDSRYYRLSLDEGNNTLHLRLDESQPGRLLGSLSGPDGEEISLEWQSLPTGEREALVTGLKPGQYQLRLSEPPRSVLFLWDGSLSVAHHQPAIYQALTRFSSALSPGKEEFNLMPLGGPLLIDDWANQPEQVAITLAAYDDRFGSSDIEPALQIASRALAQRPGEKVIFLLADAEQGRRDMQAWRSLTEIEPRIFSIEMANGSLDDTLVLRWRQQQMMSWSMLGNGRYRYASDGDDLIDALEAGMRELRSGTTFFLSVEQRFQEAPLPGSLRVVSGETPVVAGGAVQLIFDASGSMLRQMEGGRRIDVARRIVTQVLDERIPESVPIALRAFGHTAPHSCETELLVAPGELGGRETVRQAIESLQAINLARTPLAASLLAARDDLSAVAGQRQLVVMLTDGEETCDGDLEQAVQTLLDDGLDLRLNIVGFHIDDLALQAEFERLATMTAGDYFDSSDDQGLVAALGAALAAQWQLLDASGQTIAQGRVDGDEISVMPGDYEVVVQHPEGEWRHSFQVAAQEAVSLEAMKGKTP